MRLCYPYSDLNIRIEEIFLFDFKHSLIKCLEIIKNNTQSVPDNQQWVTAVFTEEELQDMTKVELFWFVSSLWAVCKVNALAFQWCANFSN